MAHLLLHPATEFNFVTYSAPTDARIACVTENVCLGKAGCCG